MAPFRTRSKSQRRREQILLTAQNVFARRGFDHTTFDNIASELGITREAVYYYFRNRTEMIFHILEIQNRKLADAIKEIMASEIPSREKLRRAISMHLAAATAAGRSGVFFSGRQNFAETDEKARAALEAGFRRYRNLWVALLEDVIRDGNGRWPGQPALVAHGVMGMLEFAVWRCDQEGDPGVEALEETYGRQILASLSCCGGVD